MTTAPQFASSQAGVVAMLSVVVTGQPRVARFHESRARGAGLRRPNPETRKVREQVCARRAARTRFARIFEPSRAADTATKRRTDVRGALAAHRGSQLLNERRLAFEICGAPGRSQRIGIAAPCICEFTGVRRRRLRRRAGQGRRAPRCWRLAGLAHSLDADTCLVVVAALGADGGDASEIVPDGSVARRDLMP